MPTLEQIPLKAWQELLAKIPAGTRVLSWLVHLDGFIRAINERDPFTFTNGGRAVQTNTTTTYLEESAVTSTELGYSSGVTSAIQTQLNAKYDKTGGAISGPVTFSGTGRIDWTKITANGAAVTGFTTASSVTDLQTAHDSNIYDAVEQSGGGNYLIVDFASVTAFNWIRILGTYSGSSAHVLSIGVEVTPFDGSTWHDMATMHHHAISSINQNFSFFVPDDSIYINSGVVKVRINHSATTVTNHHLYFDEVSLYQ